MKKKKVQCSEICGVYHGFMPISVESVSLYDYLEWLNSAVLLGFFGKNLKYSTKK